jgi:hypothetical protein
MLATSLSSQPAMLATSYARNQLCSQPAYPRNQLCSTPCDCVFSDLSCSGYSLHVHARFVGYSGYYGYKQHPTHGPLDAVSLFSFLFLKNITCTVFIFFCLFASCYVMSHRVREYRSNRSFIYFLKLSGQSFKSHVFIHLFIYLFICLAIKV